MKYFSFLKIFEKESFFFLAFILMSLAVNGNKKYMVMLFGYALILYLVSGDLVRAFWLAFVSAFLFDKVVVLLINYQVTPAILHQLPTKEVTMNFAFAFADVLLIPLLLFARYKAKSVEWGKIDILLLMLLGLGVLSAVNSPIPYYYSWYGLYKLFIYIVIFYLSRVVSIDRTIVKATLEIIMIYALLNVGLMILQSFHGGPLGLLIEDMTYPYGRFADEITSLYRPGGISWNANLTGTILLMVLPLALLGIGCTKVLFRRMSKVVSIILLIGIILTASRFIWLVTIVLLFCFGLKFRQMYINEFLKIGRKRRWIIGLVLVVIVVPFIVSRLVTLTEKEGYYYRYKQYSTAVDIILNQIVGVGLDGYRYFVLDNYQPRDYGFSVTPPHNIFLEVGSSLGVGGIVCLLLLLGWILKRVWEEWIKIKIDNGKIIYLGILCGLAVYFLVNQVYTSWYSASITKLFWLFLGFSYVEFYRQKNS